MKKLVFLTAFISTLFMVSCEKDDNLPDDTNNGNNVVDLKVEVTHTDVTIFGGDDGTITVTVTSGNPPYEYMLDGVVKNTGSAESFTFNGLTADSYEVSVKDSEDKSFDKTVTLDEADETFADLVIEITVVDNEIENDEGVIEVNVVGGKKPYMFKLNDGVFETDSVFTNLSGGTYTVTVKDDREVEVEESVLVKFGFDIIVSFTNSNNLDGDNGQIVVSSTYTNYNNYEYSIDGGNTWVSNNTFNNLSVGTYEVSIKDGEGRVRPETPVVVEIEDDYEGYRIGDEYDDGDYVGVVFMVDESSNEVKIADTQNTNQNMSFGHYENAYLTQINTGGLNWGLMDIETLNTYLTVAKDFIDDGNVFQVEVYVNTYGQRNRYWSNTNPSWGQTYKLVRSIKINSNGEYYVDDNNNNTDNSELNGTSTNMRGRYVATRPNEK